MSNPARELHAIYSEWRDEADSSGGAAPMNLTRGWNTTSGATTKYTQAMTCLLAIDRALTELERVGRNQTFRTYYTRWVQILVLYPQHWEQVSTGLYATDAMDQLDSLAFVLDVVGGDLNAAGESTLRDVIRDARALLADDNTVPDPLRRYIAMLLNRIEEALDQQEADGGFDYATALHSLWVALGAAAGMSDKAPSKWREQAAKVMPSVAGGLMTHYAIDAVDLTMKAIGWK